MVSGVEFTIVGGSTYVSTHEYDYDRHFIYLCKHHLLRPHLSIPFPHIHQMYSYALPLDHQPNPFVNITTHGCEGEAVEAVKARL
jgi:hypothetical protein